MSEKTAWALTFLNSSTILAVTVVVAFITDGLIHAGKAVTVSRMITNNYDYGLPVMILAVLIHCVSVFAYLYLLSNYLDATSLQFAFISSMCAAYITLAFAVIIVDLNMDEDAHNVIAVSTSVFALASTWIHKNWFWNVPANGETWLLATEVLVVIAATISASVFLAINSAVAEYVFILLLLIDKRIKILALESSKLIVVYVLPPRI